MPQPWSASDTLQPQRPRPAPTRRARPILQRAESPSMPTSAKNVTVYAAPVMRKLAEIAPHLQPSLRKVADFILRHPLKAAPLPIEKRAVQPPTSAAAVNRLAKAI